MVRYTPEHLSKKKRATRKLANLLIVVIFILGAAVALYPTVSNYFAEQRQTAAIEAYEMTVETADEEDLTVYWEAAQAYNDSLAGDPVQDPFQVGSGYAVPENYDEVLNLNGDGVMGYIEIPCIDVYLPIYHGTDDDALAEGVGHIEATSLPIGGDGTHSVLCAHRGLPTAELFTNLNLVEIGDVFYIHVLGETLAYQVDQILTVDPDDMSSLVMEEGEDYVTLVTCTPYGVNTQRLLVRGTRIDYEEAQEIEATATVEIDWRLVGVVAAILVMLLIILGIWISRRARRRHAR